LWLIIKTAVLERRLQVRKQYHFRPSERGRLAWDVDRLIELSKDFPRRSVALDTIRELDEVYWFDDETYQPTCRAVLQHMQLIRAADLPHPIILSADGRVMDGMHRVVKAVLDGVKQIDAVQFENTPDPDYVGRRADELPY
jgi:hypothetical protein